MLGSKWSNLKERDEKQAGKASWGERSVSICFDPWREFRLPKQLRDLILRVGGFNGMLKWYARF